MRLTVGLVTTWTKACGIAEHSAFLVGAVKQADPEIEIEIIEDLHPHAVLGRESLPDLIFLNYHAALHSQWSPDAIAQVQARGCPVGVAYHDTGVPNSDQCKGICAAADAFVVHEPYDDLEGNGRYWRMGVPGWSGVYEYDRSSQSSWCGRRPILGSIGFPFPWKNYDRLAEVTAACGWALLLLAPNATPEQIEGWRAINPHLLVQTDFTYVVSAVAMLAGCDATAFCYTCANTGQSAAVLMGIAARKPVIALETCRQFRAISEDPLGKRAIRWVGSFEGLGQRLRETFPHRYDPQIVALAEQDSWQKLGVQYAVLFHELVAG